MLARLLRSELRRSAVAATALAVLIGLTTALFVGSATLAGRTLVAVDEFWADTRAPDFVQMHTGELDPAAVDAWARQQPGVVDHQVVTTLPVPVEGLWVAGVHQAESVLEPALVTPSERFDLLLDESGAVVRPAPGEIALPVHYRAEGSAAVGDSVRIVSGGLDRTFRVSGFVRDAQMNPSMVTSKRVVVNPADYAAFAAVLAPEYLIELRLAPDARPATVRDAYVAAGMPSHGIAVDAATFKLFNALTTMVIAMTALFVAGAFMVVAAVALRYAVLAALEQDLAEIAVLKAIGAPRRALKRLFVVKYAAIAVVGVGVGAVAAWPLTELASRPMTLYVGRPRASLLLAVVPVAAAVAALLGVIGLCWLLLRRLDTLAPVEAFRTRSAGQPGWWASRLRLSRSRLGVHGFLGVQGALRPGNGWLAAVVAAAVATMVVPAGIWATINDGRFASYLGIGPAAIRIDVREGSGDVGKNSPTPAEPAQRVEALEEALERNEAVGRHVVLRGDRVELLGPGGWESVVVEAGDHTAFPLRYEAGRPATGADEIALSHNEATELATGVGQAVRLRDAGGEQQVRVVGIYQDITNSGRTAKRAVAPDSPALWHVIYLDVRPGADPARVADDLRAAHPGVKVSLISDYAQQTMGATTAQVGWVVGLAVVSGAALVGLITGLFVVLLVARESSQIAVLKAVGAGQRGLRRQYLVQFALVAAVGVVVGTLLAATLGQLAFQLAMGGFGAPGVELLPNPLVSWVALPLMTWAVVVATTAVVVRRVDRVAVEEQE